MTILAAEAAVSWQETITIVASIASVCFVLWLVLR